MVPFMVLCMASINRTHLPITPCTVAHHPNVLALCMVSINPPTKSCTVALLPRARLHALQASMHPQIPSYTMLDNKDSTHTWFHTHTIHRQYPSLNPQVRQGKNSHGVVHSIRFHTWCDTWFGTGSRSQSLPQQPYQFLCSGLPR